MSKPILVIRKKLTLTAKEKNDVLLGTVAEKNTDTYKKAKKLFEKTVSAYSQIGTLSTTETKLWFDVSEYSVKMQFVIDTVDKKKYQKFSKEMDHAFDKMNKEMDVVLKEMSAQMDKVFKDLEPAMEKAFSGFNEILNDFFGDNKKTKK